MIFNEDSRVKIPALLHFKRLGYEYQTKKGIKIDPDTNIFIDIFKFHVGKINNIKITDEIFNILIKEIKDLTSNTKDKGKSFYYRLTSQTGLKLIDLKDYCNNDFRVVSELTFKNGNEEFRPDITILINGIPLSFLEAKRPNNRQGIKAEFNRMKYRFGIEEFQSYFNQLQILTFSNNMEYNDNERVKLSGSFYTTPNGISTSYNHFREESELPISEYINENYIFSVLSDNSMISIMNNEEFNTNLSPNTPCNRFTTSMYSKNRIMRFLQYGIVYVDSSRDGLQKHIMRYPQYFASEALIPKIESGLKRGIIWHTQGSGKTALAYFMSNILRDYYQRKNIITKFYFVVDRLDLSIQASSEFSSRGLNIAPINSREDFSNNIKSSVIVESISDTGSYKGTMNVVNIQKFTEDSVVDKNINKNIQRIYFLDEVHRSYKPKGTFLANLLGSDPDGIFIGLTGTPILKDDFKSTDLFSEYIHKYYYNKSISDGYTLRIKKENISTKFKTEVRGMLDIDNEKEIPPKLWEKVTKRPEIVSKFCDYIEHDFSLFLEIQENPNLGFMIITSSSEQARLIQNWFESKENYKTQLVLYDEDNNKLKQENFRGEHGDENTYNGVVVYNMLLTGFDAPRLKRIYLLRKIKEHSLLQTLARVNRPYKNVKYGYIVDFVDITEEYHETNRRYLEELRLDLLEEDDNNLEEMFVDISLINDNIKKLNNKLFIYMGNVVNNLETFQEQINNLDEVDLVELRNDFTSYKENYNELRMAHEDVSNIPIVKIERALNEIINRLNLIRAEKNLDNKNIEVQDIDLSNLIVEFIKTGEEDLFFTSEDDISTRVNKINNALSSNQDKNDKKYLEIQESVKNFIKELKTTNDTVDGVKTLLLKLDEITIEALRLNDVNNSIINMYGGDILSMRIHKRIIENYYNHLTDSIVFSIMKSILSKTDNLFSGINIPKQVMERQMLKPIRDSFKKEDLNLSINQVKDIVDLFIEEKFS